MKYLQKIPYRISKAPVYNTEELENEYRKNGMDQLEDTFALYRIIGNDLPPRHAKGQSINNVKFILDNEPNFPNVEKYWIVNRIIDPAQKNEIVTLLDEYKQKYTTVPFIEKEYTKRDWDFESFPEAELLHIKEHKEIDPGLKSLIVDQIYRHKNNYVMNNNGARNMALLEGKSNAKWSLPWDGNCYLTEEAWQQILNTIKEKPYYKYFIVPMARILDNNKLLFSGYAPNAIEEPQIIFRRDTTEIFNENYRYGRRPKVEMLWRLGVPGPWDKWKNYVWDQAFPAFCEDAGKYYSAGWVARLNSGATNLEKDNKKRSTARQDAVRLFIDRIDCKILAKQHKKSHFLCFDLKTLKEQKSSFKKKNPELVKIINLLVIDADEALNRQRLSVVDKTSLPPSSNPHDYWHPAPYWWPNPNTKNGLPYIHKDGKRVSGTNLYEEKSEQFDRTRAQYLFDDTLILSLAYWFTEEQKYAERAVKNLETWFIDSETKMTPHLTYSQVRMGHKNNQGAATGIIEFKDLYYMLDAMQLLKLDNSLAAKQDTKIKEWLENYLHWLIASEQGKNECAANNNHGILYDLQTLSISVYLEKYLEATTILRRAQDRIGEHFTVIGMQPHEMTRTITKHYCAFNLQSWCNFAKAAHKLGLELWHYVHPKGGNLEKSLEWFLNHYKKPWPYQQIEDFEEERFIPLLKQYMDISPFPNKEISEHYVSDLSNAKPKFWPHDGIRPYWCIG